MDLLKQTRHYFERNVLWLLLGLIGGASIKPFSSELVSWLHSSNMWQSFHKEFKINQHEMTLSHGYFSPSLWQQQQDRTIGAFFCSLSHHDVIWTFGPIRDVLKVIGDRATLPLMPFTQSQEVGKPSSQLQMTLLSTVNVKVAYLRTASCLATATDEKRAAKSPQIKRLQGKRNLAPGGLIWTLCTNQPAMFVTRASAFRLFKVSALRVKIQL